MKRFIWTFMVLAFLLGACGSGPASPTDTPAAPPTNPPPNPAAGGSTFDVQITGDYTLSYTPATHQLKMVYRDVGGLWYYLQVENSFGLPVLLIGFSVNRSDDLPKAGRYTLVAGPIVEVGQVTATCSILSDERDANEMRIVYAFDQSAGTVTLDTKDNTYSGSLDFTLKGRAMAAKEYTKAITVKGTFSGVSVIGK